MFATLRSFFIFAFAFTLDRLNPEMPLHFSPRSLLKTKT
jgi:hypothetical protein